MDKIIDSFNIYTCSDRGEENPSSTGDVFELNMNNSKIDIQKGQFFRLSLSSSFWYGGLVRDAITLEDIGVVLLLLLFAIVPIVSTLTSLVNPSSCPI